MRETCMSGSMSGEEKRSDGPLGERGNERRCALLAPPVLHATALLLDSTDRDSTGRNRTKRRSAYFRHFLSYRRVPSPRG